MTELPALDFPLDRPDTRQTINTPGLILDLDALEFNIALMAEALRPTGCQLRPHSKSHKCPKIAKMQIEAGAVGICCATLDEAEVMSAHGLNNILITSPITSMVKIPRLINLATVCDGLQVVVDSPINVATVGNAAAAANIEVKTLLDVEVGFGRTGVSSVGEANHLANAIRETNGVVFAGIQAYGGHLQHTTSFSKRYELCRKTHEFVGDIMDGLAEMRIKPELVTGGGTGTQMIDCEDGPFTEIQAGSYVFMDAEYEAIEFQTNEGFPFRNSLFVQTAIISGNTEGVVTTDAGTKAFALNGQAPRIVANALQNSNYSYLGDEHGLITIAKDDLAPDLGVHVECVPSHCDPTVALYDNYHCVRGNRIVDIWPISGRGRR